MKAAIFTLNTGLYKAKKDSAAATALKRMLEQVGFEVKASGVLPEDKKVALAGHEMLPDAEPAAPHGGTPGMYLVEDLEDTRFLKELVSRTCEELPEPRKKTAGKKAKNHG